MSETSLLRSLPLRRKLALIALSVVPFLWPTLGVFFADRPSPFVFGLPFLVFWAALGAVVAGVCLSTVYLLDPRNRGVAPDLAGSGEES